MVISDKLRVAREHKKLSQKQLAELVGVTSSAITNYENGTSHPKWSIFVKLLQALEIDANSLFSEHLSDRSILSPTPAEIAHIRKYRALDEHGQRVVDILTDEETERIEKENAIRQTELENRKNRAILQDSSDFTEESRIYLRTIPLYVLPASAGTGQFLDNNDFELIEVGAEVPLSATFGVRISGDSMEPEYPDGHIAWVKRSPEVNQGQVGIFGYDGEGYIKLFRRGWLISLNPQYDPIIIEDFERLYVYGIVVGVSENVY